MFVEHALDGPKALEDSFRVINAIDAHSEIADVNSQFVENLAARGGTIAVNVSSMLRICVSDADRKWADESLMALAADGEAVPVGIRFECAVHRLKKIIAMRLHVEADQIGAQQAIQQFALPRANSKRFRIRPRNVPEDSDTRVRALLFDEPWQKREMIILHQNHGRFRAAQFFDHDFREFFIYALILQPVIGTEKRARVRDVAERPEPFVRETVIVAVFFFLGQPDASQRVVRIVRRHANVVVLVDSILISVARAMCDPCAVASQHDGLKRSYDAAGGNDGANRSVLIAHVEIRLAIRNHEQRGILQFAEDPFAQTSFFISSSTRGAETLRHLLRFVRQRREDSGAIDGLRRGFAQSQRTHPSGHATDGFAEYPAHHYQRQESDE